MAWEQGWAQQGQEGDGATPGRRMVPFNLRGGRKEREEERGREQSGGGGRGGGGAVAQCPAAPTG